MAYYTVETGNKFCLLEEYESDDDETKVVITKEAREKAVADAPGSGAEVPAPVSAKPGFSPTRNRRGNQDPEGWIGGGKPRAPAKGGEWRGDGERRGRGGRDFNDRPRGDRRGGRGGFGGRQPEDGVEQRPFVAERGFGADGGFLAEGGEWEEQKGDGFRGGRGGGGRGARVQRGGRGGYSGRGREFDRHSGTGRDQGEKKGGGGAHNWGHEEVGEGAAVSNAWDQPQPDGESPVAGENIENAPAGDENGTTPANAEQPPRKPREDEPQSKSIEQWREEQKQARAALPLRVQEKHQIMTPEQLEKEGFLGNSKLSSTRDLSTKEQVDRDDEVEVKHKRGGLTMNYYEFAAKNGNDPFRNRGRGRGRGGRGGHSESPTNNEKPNKVYVQPFIELDDPNQFPMLG